ncbi:MAG: hypothetical protein M1834_003498 [Cirrosporium novae-zelandiae]|nr:MAG: hypothetical protein M1834_003498 [Cirrosporium novae-zelandiae]
MISSNALALSSRLQSSPPSYKLSQEGQAVFDESHEIYDPFTQPLRQRQQQQQFSQIHTPPRPSSSSGGSIRTLRRTPEDSNLRSRRAASLDIEPPVPELPDPLQPRPRTPRQPPSEGNSTTREAPTHSFGLESYWPERSLRVSERTASAILFALEEAIRTPFQFTPVVEEENASMSELGGGTPSSATGGNGRAQNGGVRSASGPVPVSQYPSDRVRTPTDIMRQRRDREARKKAEQEARQREQEEEERRRHEERRAAAAGVGGDVSGVSEGAPQRRPSAPTRRTEPDTGYISEQTRKPTERVSSGNPPRVNVPTGAPQPLNVPGAAGRSQDPNPQLRAAGGNNGNGAAVPPASSRTRGTTLSQGQPRPVSQPPRATSESYRPQQGRSSQARQPSGGRSASQAQPPLSSTAPQTQANQNGHPVGTSRQRDPTQSAFPHAFERWEQLSSHWEGLTSYWIRRLEQNGDELSRDPLSQQLSRQITDLSAAGANLFHAVVELQRLRASSERKFQRWFFETRSEQERAQEMLAEKENALRTERQAHADVANTISKLEAEKKQAEQRLKEMGRELQISKEEARRAWEELGRREQEERDRTLSLRNGEPTLVGGVQVVPMMQGVPARQGSVARPPTREGPYAGGPSPTTMGGQPARPVEIEREISPTNTDPFVEEQESQPPLHQEPPESPATPTQQMPGAMEEQTETTSTSSTPVAYFSQAPPQPASTAPFYQQESTALEEPRSVSEAEERSYVPSSVGGSEDDYEYDEGEQPRRYEQPVGSENSDEYDVSEQQEREKEYSQRYGGISGVEYGSGSTSTTSSGPFGYGMSVPDYSGSDYGMGTGWEAVPRHHHPTRLSDVLEEDERSRTSPSRASSAR